MNITEKNKMTLEDLTELGLNKMTLEDLTEHGVISFIEHFFEVNNQMNIIQRYETARAFLIVIRLNDFFEDFFETSVVTPRTIEAYKTFEKRLKENKNLPKKILEDCIERYTLDKCLESLKMGCSIFTYYQMEMLVRCYVAFGKKISRVALKDGYAMEFQKVFEQVGEIYFLLIDKLINDGYVEDADLRAADEFYSIVAKIKNINI